MNRFHALASAVAALLVALNITAAAIPTASPAVRKFTAAVVQAQQSFNSVSQPGDAFKSSFDKQLQKALGDAKCVMNPDNSLDCSKADPGSLDAGNSDLQSLNGLVTDEKAREIAPAMAKQQLGQLGTQIAAALPNVNDTWARAGYNQQLNQELSKDGCTFNSNYYFCSSSSLSLDKLNSEIDNLKSLLAAVNGDNATNPRAARLKVLAQTANQVVAVLSKMISAQDQASYRRQLDQHLGHDSGGDGCGFSGGAFDCSHAYPAIDAVDKEIAWVQSLLATVTAANADPRPALLTQFTQLADRAQISIASLPNPNDKNSLGQKLTQVMATDACRLVSGAYDCSQTTVSTANLASAIAAVQSLVDAAMASRAADPSVVTRSQIQLAANNAVLALANVQDPVKRNGFSINIAGEATTAGCVSTNPYWDCSKASNLNNASGIIDGLQHMLAQMNQTGINNMGAQSVQPLVNTLQNIAGLVANVSNKDQAASLTAKLTAVVAEGGCQTAGASYDCSKSTYAQYQKATADATALLPVVRQTLVADGPIADHTAAAAAAAALQNTGRQLSPQSARDAFNASWLAALSKANCAASASAVDCSKATAVQLGQLNKDLAALQSQAQASVSRQQSSGAASMPAYSADDLSKAMAILNNTNKMIDGAAIPDAKKQPLYDKVSALRDQLEAQSASYKPNAPQGPTAGQKVQNAMGSGILAGTIGGAASSLADTVSPTRTSGSFGPSPSASAAVLQTQIQAAIASAGAH